MNTRQALFPELTGPLDAATKQFIYSSYRRGINVDTLAKSFQRTRTSMYRVINEIRAQRLLEQPLDYIHITSFDDPTRKARSRPHAGRRGLRGQAAPCTRPRTCRRNWPRATSIRCLSKDQEQHLFRKMNFLKHKAASCVISSARKAASQRVDPGAVNIRRFKEIEDLRRRPTRSRSCSSRQHALVVNIAKRHAGQSDNFFELMSDGNMSLIRAVEKFDYSRGFKFSTYASWAIMKNFARSIPEEIHRRERFVTGHEEVFDAAPDGRTDEHEVVATTNGRRTVSIGCWTTWSRGARDHSHEGRSGRSRQEHDAGGDRPAVRHHQGARARSSTPGP